MFVQRRFDLGRVDIETAVDDQLFRPAENVQVSLGVEPPDIASAQPAIRPQHLPGGIGVAEIAAHDVRATAQDLARPITAAGDRVINADVTLVKNTPARDIGAADRIARHRHARCRLGHAIAVLQGNPIERLGPAFPIRVQRRRPRRDIAQAGAVQRRVTLLADIVHQLPMHLRHPGKQRHPLHQRLVQARDRESRLHHQARTRDGHRHKQRGQTKHMADRQNAIDQITLRHPPQIAGDRATIDQIAMAQHDPFGNARCAGGIKDHRQTAHRLGGAVMGAGHHHAPKGTLDRGGGQPLGMGFRIGRDVIGEQNNRRLRMGDHAVNLGAGLAGVDRHDNRAKLPTAKDGCHGGGAVLQHDHDPVARLHAFALKAQRHLARRRGQRGPAPDNAGGIGQRHPVGHGGRVAGQIGLDPVKMGLIGHPAPPSGPAT